MPFRKEWNENKGDFWTDVFATNIILPAIAQLTIAGLKIGLVIPAAWLQEKISLEFWATESPILVQVLIATLIAEFGYYWFHRYSHRNPFFWRFHSTHHGARRVYWANSGNFHPLDAFFGFFCYLFPLIILGIPDHILIIFMTFSATTGVLEHANFNFKASFWNYVFNSAELHRWHHEKNKEEGLNNYGKITSLWDLVFRTFYLPKDKYVAEIGLEDDQEIVPVHFIGQLKYPFSVLNSSPESSET